MHIVYLLWFAEKHENLFYQVYNVLPHYRFHCSIHSGSNISILPILQICWFVKTPMKSNTALFNFSNTSESNTFNISSIFSNTSESNAFNFSNTSWEPHQYPNQWESETIITTKLLERLIAPETPLCVTPTTHQKHPDLYLYASVETLPYLCDSLTPSLMWLIPYQACEVCCNLWTSVKW